MSKPGRPLVLIGLPALALDSSVHDGLAPATPDGRSQTLDLVRQAVADAWPIARLELLHQPRHASRATSLAHELATLAPDLPVRTHEIPFADAADFEQVYAALHDFAVRYPFTPEEEDYLVHTAAGSTATGTPSIVSICLVLLVASRHLPARLVQLSSAPHGNSNAPPNHPLTIVDLDLSHSERLAARLRREQREGLSFLKAGIDTRNAAFNLLIERIERVALASRAPLLLQGPDGAGKSRLARRIYELKRTRHRIAGPFVEFNCATLRGPAATSALFGHRGGTAAGARRDRAGLLRTANDGVLFLDEIGELALDDQAVLLRALEQKTFLPLGADHDASSDVQLIAGTNHDLAPAVRQGRFRDDLFARVSLWTFHLPGLTHRPEDLSPNLDYELAEYARTHGALATFDPEARERFLRFATSPLASWPANFRDFNASIVRMATLAPHGRITPDIVDGEIAHLRRAWTRSDESPDSLVTLALGPERSTELDRFDRVQLEDVLRVCRERRTLSDAGRALYSVSRTTRRSTNDADRLRKYLARFGLEWQTLRALLDRHV